MFVDTHCHLDDPCFSDRLSEILAGAARAGVGSFVVPGVDSTSWVRMQRLSRPNVFPAYGLHPQAAGEYADVADELDRVAPAGIAVGEIGLDYVIDVHRAVQQEAFRGQLRLARRLGLPVLIHCRRAFADLLRIVDEEGVCGGVMHAFSGSVETAGECLRRGLYISVAGPVTWANAVRPRRVVESVPLDRLLLETDSPDLTPEPHRGKPNEPSYLPLIAAEVARLKGVPVEEVARVTTDNAGKIFRAVADNQERT